MKKPKPAKIRGRKSVTGEHTGESPRLYIRVAPAQQEKYYRLGGPVWFRAVLDKAKENGA